MTDPAQTMNPAPALVPGPEGALGILPSLHTVMDEIKSVGKDGRNDFSGYNFRGIDGVLNAVGPALRKHAVLLVPTVEHIDYGSVPAKGGSMMTAVRLRMRATLYAMDGSSMSAVVWGEAFDTGDKATAKAHSVALRTALIQVLALPTQEPDPDETTYERQAPQAPPRSNEDVLADAETATAAELAAMVRAAERQMNRPLYDALVSIGRRRFPSGGEGQ